MDVSSYSPKQLRKLADFIEACEQTEAIEAQLMARVSEVCGMLQASKNDAIFEPLRPARGRTPNIGDYVVLKHLVREPKEWYNWQGWVVRNTGVWVGESEETYEVSRPGIQRRSAWYSNGSSMLVIATPQGIIR